MVWYNLEHNIADDSYYCTIPLSDFNYAFGTYRINVYSDFDDNHTYIGSYYVAIEDPQANEKEEIPIPEIYIGDVDYQTSEVDVSVYGVPGDVVLCNIAVWHNEDQSDLIWYQADKHEDGLYHIRLKMTNYGILNDKYNVHVYCNYPDGELEILLADTVVIG